MLRAGRLPVMVPLTCALIAAAGCQSREVPSSESSTGAVPPSVAAPAPAAATSDLSSPADAPPACATLRDVSASDVVRVEGTTLFYAETATGLTVVDVADPAAPRRIANVPFVGKPVALFVREGVAWVVFNDFDGRFAKDGSIATVVRAVDVRSPASPVPLGDEVRDGTLRDVKLVGGVLYTLAATSKGSTVESFRVRNGKLEGLDRVAVSGAPAQLAASPYGLAVVTTADTQADVTWLELPLERPGALVVGETLRVSGGAATWERGEGRVADAAEDRVVRVVTCTTRSCAPPDSATLHVLDFGTTEHARERASLKLTERGGLPLTRFSNDMLFVAETATSARDMTNLRVVRAGEGAPQIAATLGLRGLISGLVARDGSLVALGTDAATESQARIVLYDIDVRRPGSPRIRGSATFGSDWTWSPALDDEDALSFDPASHLVAIPFTAWRYADKRGLAGTQLVDLGRRGLQSFDSVPSDDFVERAVFLGGHLVTIGPNGVRGVPYGGTRLPDSTERRLDLGPLPAAPALR